MFRPSSTGKTVGFDEVAHLAMSSFRLFCYNYFGEMLDGVLVVVIKGILLRAGVEAWLLWLRLCTLLDFRARLTLADRVPLPAASIRFFDVVVQTIHWLLWRFRNDTTFATKRPNKQLIIDDVKLSSFNWISSRQKKGIEKDPKICRHGSAHQGRSCNILLMLTSFGTPCLGISLAAFLRLENFPRGLETLSHNSITPA
ncbi:hypothetical protein Tco_1314919 [Tanacetum coccineum]